MGMHECQPDPPRTPGRRPPCSVVVYSLLGSFLAVFLVLALVSRPRLDMSDFYPYGDTCHFNLKMLCLAFDLYAADHGGVFPELSPKPGLLAVRDDPDYPGVYPEYLQSTELLTCPSARALRPRAGWFREDSPTPPELDTVSSDRCYVYLGYVIPDQAALERFAEAYRARVAEGRLFDEDLNATTAAGGTSVVPRLRKGIAGVTNTDEAQSAIPVFVERYPNGHVGDIGHVVYLDGRAEWIKWGAKWPMTPEAMDVLLALDALGNAPPD